MQNSTLKVLHPMLFRIVTKFGGRVLLEKTKMFTDRHKKKKNDKKHTSAFSSGELKA